MTTVYSTPSGMGAVSVRTSSNAARNSAAAAGSPVRSSVQQSAPCSARICAPMLCRGCQSDTTAPVGSWIVAMRPASNTSNGSASTVPPCSTARTALASASSTVR